MRCGGGDRVDQGLQGLFINVTFLQKAQRRGHTQLTAAVQDGEINEPDEETHQLLVAEGGGSHGRGDSSLAGVLHQRLKTAKQDERVVLTTGGVKVNLLIKQKMFFFSYHGLEETTGSGSRKKKTKTTKEKEGI